ncbi:MAG TPA: NAD(P)H-dependent oxidoreductase [Cytophagaceae bacterium]|jgi:NAD(P)H-dependent FMN reductase|nr:NAD(P)H-dependent oxidoreductase [Cytophagaceae bacterium]
MISIISSTNRPNSRTLKVATFYKELLDSKGVESRIIDLALLPEDFAFTALYHNQGKNELFNVFARQVNESKKFVFIVPEYNGSFPGILKTFIDGMDYPDGFKDKKCALVGISAGALGSSLALSHLTDIFNYMNMYVLPSKPRMAKLDSVFREGKIIDKFLAELVEKQVEDLIKF